MRFVTVIQPWYFFFDSHCQCDSMIDDRNEPVSDFHCNVAMLLGCACIPYVSVTV